MREKIPKSFTANTALVQFLNLDVYTNTIQAFKDPPQRSSWVRIGLDFLKCSLIYTLKKFESNLHEAQGVFLTTKTTN